MVVVVVIIVTAIDNVGGGSGDAECYRMHYNIVSASEQRVADGFRLRIALIAFKDSA